MSVPVLTDLPSSAVTTSPWPMPAAAAGVPDCAPAIATPCVVWKPWPEESIDTPRNAVAPMCTVEDAWPVSICLAMVKAVLIGMAYPCVVEPDELEEPDDPEEPEPEEPDEPEPEPNPPNPPPNPPFPP